MAKNQVKKRKLRVFEGIFASWAWKLFFWGDFAGFDCDVTYCLSFHFFQFIERGDVVAVV